MADDRTYRSQIGIGDRGAYSAFLRSKGLVDDEAGALAFLKQSGRPFKTAAQTEAERRAIQDRMVSQGVGTKVGTESAQRMERGTTNQNVIRQGVASNANAANMFSQPQSAMPAYNAQPALDIASILSAASNFAPGGDVGPEGRAAKMLEQYIQSIYGGK
jgi:hypothetical protein